MSTQESTDFRWPRKGDTLFTQAENSYENAEIAGRSHSRLVMMFTGYKLGGDLMVQHSNQGNCERAALVYPIVFNYRHFIELALKYIIATYGGTVGIKPNWNTHDLETLWCTFRRVLIGYGHEDPDGTDQVISKTITEFSKVDERSFSFRYPVDRQGRKIPLGHEELDLNSLADVMKGLEGYFIGTDGYLDNLQNAGP
ncbi:MAG: hypothetical protein RIK87_30955 [Fuerstiella sp.]